MGTQGLKINQNAWINLVDVLSLEIGQVYTLQNTSNNPLFLHIAETIPLGTEPYHIVLPKEDVLLVPRENIGIWAIASSAIDGSVITIAVTENETIPAKESNGAQPVNVQDQHSRMLDLQFIQAQGQPVLTTAIASMEDTTITIANTIGFVDGNVIGLFSNTGEFYFGQQIGDPVGNVIMIDTPIDTEYPIGSNVITAIKNMAVDGSIDMQVFQIGPVGVATTVYVDTTRVMGYLQSDAAMDDSRFGSIAGGLIYGVVLRKNNGVMQNYWNKKTNGEIAELCFDFAYTPKAPAGSYGARFRNTFAGQSKHGVTIRLDPGDTLEILIQDDLSSLEAFTMTAQGHVVTD